jgi:hypothetical protein
MNYLLGDILRRLHSMEAYKNMKIRRHVGYGGHIRVRIKY